MKKQILLLALGIFTILPFTSELHAQVAETTVIGDGGGDTDDTPPSTETRPETERDRGTRYGCPPRGGNNNRRATSNRSNRRYQGSRGGNNSRAVYVRGKKKRKADRKKYWDRYKSNKKARKNKNRGMSCGVRSDRNTLSKAERRARLEELKTIRKQFKLKLREEKLEMAKARKLAKTQKYSVLSID